MVVGWLRLLLGHPSSEDGGQLELFWELALASGGLPNVLHCHPGHRIKSSPDLLA